MPNTFSQIDMHLVFAVRNRESIILPEFREQIFKYITGIIIGKKQKLLAINGGSDHIHIFFGMQPTLYIPEFVKVIKVESTKFIKNNKFLKSSFQWQDGYGIFAHSKSDRSRVINYILNQENHHRKRSFREEYLDMLKKMEIDFDTRYLFDFFQ
jgi:REP element-mobilizing transposase RayT